MRKRNLVMLAWATNTTTTRATRMGLGDEHDDDERDKDGDVPPLFLGFMEWLSVAEPS